MAADHPRIQPRRSVSVRAQRPVEAAVRAHAPVEAAVRAHAPVEAAVLAAQVRRCARARAQRPLELHELLSATRAFNLDHPPKPPPELLVTLACRASSPLTSP